MQQVEIRVKGKLDADWSEWFEGLEITYHGDSETVLSGSLQDQSALYGMLTRLRNLGLALVSVMTTDPENGNRDWVTIDNPD
ncbi:MAG: hypothetical protein JSV61_15640 [Anaerolineales bacterium]|nr:MAG: hypothetical protein JSV61_15640 [Anaerolineales bacterium]